VNLIHGGYHCAQVVKEKIDEKLNSGRLPKAHRWVMHHREGLVQRRVSHISQDLSDGEISSITKVNVKAERPAFLAIGLKRTVKCDS
jgi:hypothetical protein